MTLKAPLAIAISVVALQICSIASIARAEEHGERHREARPLPPRAAPPRFQAHPPGARPHGPSARPHPVRVLSAKVATYGSHQWRHWEHPEFARPAYYWDWGIVHNVTCTAEDSYGDQYPVTEATFRGFGLVNMTAVEDDALDRCNVESGGDQSCYLLTCSHF